MKQQSRNKKKLIVVIKVIIALTLISFLIRGLFFEKKVSFAIAQESDKFIPDLTVKIDNEIVFNDTILLGPIPCCSAQKKIDFGIHKITIESASQNLKKEFEIAGFKDTHIFLAVWEKENGELWIEKAVYYFTKPMYD